MDMLERITTVILFFKVPEYINKTNGNKQAAMDLMIKDYNKSEHIIRLRFNNWCVTHVREEIKKAIK
uniref:Uncharacterized protein n=1 Tax=viral metagenome TaxID=1070528 RepID=A0A6M3JS75_9ZZZZ